MFLKVGPIVVGREKNISVDLKHYKYYKEGQEFRIPSSTRTQRSACVIVIFQGTNAVVCQSVGLKT